MKLSFEQLIEIAKINSVEYEVNSNKPHQIYDKLIGDYRDLTEEDIDKDIESTFTSNKNPRVQW